MQDEICVPWGTTVVYSKAWRTSCKKKGRQSCLELCLESWKGRDMRKWFLRLKHSLLSITFSWLSACCLSLLTPNLPENPEIYFWCLHMFGGDLLAVSKTILLRESCCKVSERFHVDIWWRLCNPLRVSFVSADTRSLSPLFCKIERPVFLLHF